MFVDTAREQSRAAAHAWERTLPTARRKQLGQYFTGLPLGRLLAHLALSPDARTVLDPMAGHGDLLDAVWEASAQRGVSIARLDGVEVDSAAAAVCRRRLASIAGDAAMPKREIVAGDAFTPATIRAVPERSYDLVITNPPYVRYQVRGRNGTGPHATRAGLRATLVGVQSGSDAHVWRALAQGYSGLADLSVPAWLLAAAMVRPSGRLALVVPATWRSREYADVIRYLLLRCFELECIVADRQPGWFSEALVRTHLLVARRLSAAQSRIPICDRTGWSSPPWVEIAPQAAAEGSLVGAVPGTGQAEASFASRLYDGCLADMPGVSTRRFDLERETAVVEQRAHRRPWFRRLEAGAGDLPLFATAHAGSTASAFVPESIADLLPTDIRRGGLTSLAGAGISVGQGLRTGCNGFFYVTACGTSQGGEIVVEASRLVEGSRFPVPAAALRPVLRRQAEVPEVAEGRSPDGRILDLRLWVLPADLDAVQAARSAYARTGEPMPAVMPGPLAHYVRVASATIAGGINTGARIPALSAVRTNVRPSRDGRTTPRFWYMLPDFAPRHLPAAFVARVNHSLPRAGANLDPALVVDANFSTFWTPSGGWTRAALTALLNSVWCRAAMEALGTPLGGGALKLEAAQLRNMAIPVISDAMRDRLDGAGRELARGTPGARARIDAIVLGAVVAQMGRPLPIVALAAALEERSVSLSAARRR